MPSLLRRRSVLASLVIALVLALGTGAAVVRLRAAHAASVADSTCTSASFAQNLIDAGSSGTITFDCSSEADIGVSSTIEIASGASLVINSIGSPVWLDGNGSVQLFIVDSGGSLAIDTVNLENGAAPSSFGGAIQNNGTLHLDHSTLKANAANYSGAIGTNSGATAVIADSTFEGNTATHNGGAMASDGSLIVTNSTFNGNSADRGGAIATDSAAHISYSTFVGNTATTSGAGISMFVGSFGTFSSTIGESIVAGNTVGSSAANCDATGLLQDLGYNLEDSDTGTDCGFSAASNDQLVATLADAHLGALGSYAGPTQTIPLGAGSPALNAIPNDPTTGCGTTLITDQRGISRPQGANCDIGAYELELPSAALTIGSPQAVVASVTYVTGATPLTLTGSDDGPGVGSVSYCVYPQGGSCAGSFTAVNADATSFTLGTGPADGAYTIAYYATDALGSDGATSTTSLTLDNTSPATTLAVGDPQATVGGALEVTSQTPITLSATDGGSGVTSVAYRFYPKGTSAPAFTTVSGATVTFKLTGADGVYEVDYDATDRLGNDPAKTKFITLANATLLVGADVAGPGAGTPPTPPAIVTATPDDAQANVATSANGVVTNQPATAGTGKTGSATQSMPTGWLLALLGLLALIVLSGAGGLLYLRTSRCARRPRA